MKLLGNIIAKRQRPFLGPEMAESQCAHQRRRSCELLLVDQRSFVGSSVADGRIVYGAGLDVEAAFDNADLQFLIRALGDLAAPEILTRSIGNWVTKPTTDGARGTARQQIVHSKRGGAPRRSAVTVDAAAANKQSPSAGQALG